MLVNQAGSTLTDPGMTFKAELFFIVGLIVVSLILAHMLEGTGLATLVR